MSSVGGRACLATPVMRVIAPDIPLPNAPQREDFILPQSGDIVRTPTWVAA
jgi:pyruvate/2-oxoglutarate/acetoin dehydrogenase E1 component